MANEITQQREIKESVLALGGYAVKLTNRFTIGIPDLGIWLPSLCPVVCEVKDLGVVTDEFDRTLGVTPKQADVMRRISKPYGSTVALVLVHALHRGERRLIALPHTATRLRWDYGPFAYDVRRRTGIRYPSLSTIFRNLGVAEI